MKKKILAILLSIAMVASMFTNVVWATDTDVTLQKDVMNYTYSGTYDLEGATYQVGNEQITVDGELTIKNGTIDITGVHQSANSIFYLGDATDVLTLENVTVIGDGYSSAYGVLYAENGTININGCTFNLKNEQYEGGAVIKGNTNTSLVNIRDSKFTLVDVVSVIKNINVDIDNTVIDAKYTDPTAEVGGLRNHALRGVYGSITNSTITLNGFETGIKNDGADTLVIDGTSAVTLENNDSDLTLIGDTKLAVDASATLTYDENNSSVAADTIITPTTYTVGEGKAYADLDAAIAAAVADDSVIVVYEIYGKQTISRDNYFDVAGTSAIAVTFAGMDDTAEIFLNNTNDNDPHHASNAGIKTSANLTFKNIAISHNKPVGLYKYDAGHRAGLFSIDGDITVTFDTCTFDRGVYTAVDNTVVTNCTFVGTESGEYMLWVAGRGEGSTLSVSESEFTGYRAIKLYNEGHTADVAVTVTDSTFEVTEKAAVETDGATASLVMTDNTFTNCDAVNDKQSNFVNADYEESNTFETKVTGLSGEGTEASPYLINNLDELKWFRDDVNAGNTYKGEYVKLTADINLYEEDADGNQISWTPIGDMDVDKITFHGTFDGDNHTISNLYISAADTGLGFFGRTGSFGEGTKAVIKNIIFENVDVSSSITTGHGGSYVGGIIANSSANTTVSNVHLKGYIYIAGYGYIGGIIGHGYPTVENCSVIAEDGSYIHSYYWCAGGIVGYGGEGTGATTIKNCKVSGIDIWSAYGAAASVCGLAQTGAVGENLTVSDVNISSNSDYVMGYVFGNGEEGTLSDITLTNVTATAKGEEITPTDAVAKINDAVYFNLADALAAVKDGETITLFETTIEEGTVKLPATLKNVTIKGGENTVIKNTTIASADSNSLVYEGITFDGITFDNSNIYIMGWIAEESFKNWTITNCIFKNVEFPADSTLGVVHFNLDTQAPMTNITFTNNTIDGVTGKENSGLYLVATGDIVITGNTIKNTSGTSIVLTPVGNYDVDINNNTFENWGQSGAGRALRVDATNGVSGTIDYNENTLSAENPPEEYVKLTKYTESTVISLDKNYWGGNNPTDSGLVTADGVEFTNYYANAERTNLVSLVPTGTLSSAYTSANTYWGECGGNAKESFVFKFYNDNTYMGYTSLNNVGGIIDGDVYVSWHIKLDAASNTDEYWDMAWEVAPTIAMQPNRVEQWVDGVKVAECAIQPNWSDSIFPVVAAVTDADGKILSYVNGTTGATLADAFANGGNIVLLSNINLGDTTITVPAGTAVTLDLNGKTISGVCNADQQSMIIVENTADLTVKDSAGNGKITYAAGTSNVGFAIDVKGDLILESGTIELTGSWSLGFAVDVRPNSWGTEYTEGTTFVMNGGKIISSDTAVRVASSSADTHENVSASFTMNGGEIVSDWDAIFIHHWSACDYNITINGGSISGKNSPIRIYGDSVVNDVTLTIKGGVFTYTGEAGTSGWVVQDTIKGTESVVNEADIAISGGTFPGDVNDYCADGFACEQNADGTYSVVESEEEPVIEGGVFCVINKPLDDNGNYQVGIYHGIDSLAYKEVGFEIYDGRTDTLVASYNTNTVYSSLTVTQNDGTTVTKTAEELNSFRFFGINAHFGTAWDNIPIKFRAYAVDLEGNTIYGTMYLIPDIYTLNN